MKEQKKERKRNESMEIKARKRKKKERGRKRNTREKMRRATTQSYGFEALFSFFFRVLSSSNVQRGKSNELFVQEDTFLSDLFPPN